jgi:multidrug efflux pump subunit AcrA (membrane-fusion protein)
VRHNAALALVRFGDASARPALVEMLQPTMLQAEYDGTIELIVKEESAALAPGTPLLRIKKDNGEIVEMHSREAGRIETIAVADGARVTKGTELMSLSPESEQVRSALVALYLMGQPDDIPYVQRYVRQTGTMPDTVQKQALSTLEAIRERTGKVQ